MEKKLPVALTILNAVISGASSYKGWPIKIFTGLEFESVLFAIIGASIGTYLGLMSMSNKKLAAILITGSFLLVLAVLTYSRIFSQAGSTVVQIYFAIFLLLIGFGIFSFIVTQVEKAIAKKF